jgi:hypothetical protein
MIRVIATAVCDRGGPETYFLKPVIGFFFQNGTWFLSVANNK